MQNLKGDALRWVSKAQVNIGGLNVLTRREGCYARFTLRQATKLGRRLNSLRQNSNSSKHGGILYTFAGGGDKIMKISGKAYKKTKQKKY